MADGGSLDEEITRRVQVLISQAVNGGVTSVDNRFSMSENITSAAMKLVQQACVQVMSRTIERAIDRSGIDPAGTALALSGGYALNCPSNSALLTRFGFAEFLETPSVSDCGQSIGIGLAQFLHQIPGSFSYRFPGASLGSSTGGLESLRPISTTTSPR